MTLLWGMAAVGIALAIAIGLYNYFTSSQEIEDEIGNSIGNETPEERAAVIARHQQKIEERRREERDDPTVHK